MDMQHSEQGHIIEVCSDLQVQERTSGVNKICDGAPCGFSNAKYSPKEAQEQCDSMLKLLISVSLYIIFMAIEVVGGIEANSLAILTYAAQLLSDAAAFAILLFSLWASGWEATPRQSYGFCRIEILGALVLIQMIWLFAGILVYEAISRFFYETGEVHGFLMFLVSAFGVVVNIVIAVKLGHDHGHSHGHAHGHSNDHGHGHGHGHDHGDANEHNHENSDDSHTHGVTIKTQVVNKTGNSKHDKHHHHAHDTDHTVPLLGPSSKSEGEHNKQKKQRNINVQGAYLHVLGHSIQSIVVMIGGAIIWYKPEWKIIDLICTLIFSLIVLGTTFNMLGNIWEVLIANTPREIDATRLEEGLCEIDEVVAIQELHIWAISVGKVLLACHVKVKPEADADMVLGMVVDYIKKKYYIIHVTIQIEREPQT